jgi:ABC-type nickel/cobalt efflux system permease component RcnA
VTARAAVAVVACLLSAAVAGAHPLGNASVNRWTALEVGADGVAVRTIVDLAEIPAFQAIRAHDGDGDGTLDAAERSAYATAALETIVAALSLALDGRPVRLAAGATRVELLPGAAGLSTLRLEVELHAPLAGPAGTLVFRDGTFAGRPGWREIVARAGAGATLAHATVPSVDASAALTAYPASRLAAPPQVTEATLVIAPGGGARDAAPVAAAAPRVAPPDRLAGLLAGPAGPGTLLAAVLLAAGLGAVHALSPGHGKAIVAAYLVGTRGTTREAVALGLVVTATHTVGVYAFGLVTLGASAWVLPERLFPWLGLLSGLGIAALGASLLRERLHVALAHAHDRHHHDHHAHDHPHDPHDHHHHRHDVPSARAGWRGLVALGVSGGLVPCPSALVLMLGAIALGRTALGLGLVVAFSAGLAGVLIAVGVVFVHARGLLDRLPARGTVLRVGRFAPVASAVVVSLAGMAIVLRALGEIGA